MIDKLQIINRFTKIISVQIFLQEWLSKTIFTWNYLQKIELLLFTWIIRVYIDLCVAVFFSNSLECGTPQNMAWHTTECCMAHTCTLWDAYPFSSESWRGRLCSAAWSCCPARWTSAGKCLAVNRRGVSKAGRPPLGGQDRVVPYSSSSPLIRFVLNSREVMTCPVDSKLHFWGVRNNVEFK